MSIHDDPPGDIDPHGATVLIIDDDEGLLGLLRAVIASFPFRVILTSSPEEGREILENRLVGVLVCDLRMPGIHGRELIEHARNISPHIVTIAMSGYSTHEDVIDSINRGILWRFISKPFDINNFLSLVREGVHRHEEDANRDRFDGVADGEMVDLISCRVPTPRVRHFREDTAKADAAEAPAPPPVQAIQPPVQPVEPVKPVEPPKPPTPPRLDLSQFKSDRYQVICRTGQGAGRVYKAHDSLLDLTVALKFLYPATGEDGLVRLRYETRRVMQLSHRSIVRLYDLKAEHELYYLVMEFVEGMSLAQMLALDGAQPLNIVMQIAAACAAALDYAHSQEVHHLDLKPSNVLLSNSGAVKVADFGQAQMAGGVYDEEREADAERTRAYASPEFISGAPADARADVYSMGIVLYEALSGGLPFPANAAADDPARDQPCPLAGVTAGVWAQIATAIARNPEDRWSSAGQFYNALLTAAKGA